jgi:hypothetical protein
MCTGAADIGAGIGLGTGITTAGATITRIDAAGASSLGLGNGFARCPPVSLYAPSRRPNNNDAGYEQNDAD